MDWDAKTIQIQIGSATLVLFSKIPEIVQEENPYKIKLVQKYTICKTCDDTDNIDEKYEADKELAKQWIDEYMKKHQYILKRSMEKMVVDITEQERKNDL